jgi:hypothetical protein
MEDTTHPLMDSGLTLDMLSYSNQVCQIPLIYRNFYYLIIDKFLKSHNLKGSHNVEVNVGYYTGVYGLGVTPADTSVHLIQCENGDFDYSGG